MIVAGQRGTFKFSYLLVVYAVMACVITFSFGLFGKSYPRDVDICVAEYGKGTFSRTGIAQIRVACGAVAQGKTSEYHKCILEKMPGAATDQVAFSISRLCAKNTGVQDYPQPAVERRPNDNGELTSEHEAPSVPKDFHIDEWEPVTKE